MKRIQIIANSNTDRFLKLTNIASRFFYMLYWLMDNVHVLMKVLNLNKIYPTVHLSHKVKTCAKYFWLAGLSLFLLICCKIIRKTYTDESDLKVAALNKMTV